MEILIVDDDQEIRECLTDLLEANYKVDIAENGLVALGKITAEPQRYGVMLLDILMPVMDGSELLRQLASQDLMIPTVVISAIKRNTELFMPWLVKPFDLDTLFAAIQDCEVRGGRRSL